MASVVEIQTSCPVKRDSVTLEEEDVDVKVKHVRVLEEAPRRSMRARSRPKAL
jgi:acetyl/propionyl-CoA carboxylase alpha subunit